MSLDPLRRWEQRFGALPLPSPLVWAALVVAFLGFGVLMGRTTGPSAVDSLVSSRVPLKVVVAQGGATATTPNSTPAVAPPPAAEETTPEQAPAEPAKSSPPTSAGKPSGSSAGPKEASGASKEPTGASKESQGASEGSSSKVAAKLPAIKHVFVIVLSEEPYATAFGPASPAKYLTGTLEKQGELLLRYYAVAHQGLADGIALLSGQGPTEATAANCPTYSAISPASAGSDGQVLGKGCLYPTSTPTLMGQLAAKHLTWKAYVEGIDEGASTLAACAHPASGAADPSASLTAGGVAPAYQTWRNPFVYFGSIAGSATCASGDLGMSALKGNLAAEKSTANFSYIAPGPCDDGSPTPCAPGRTSGMMAADEFLHKIVPVILSSSAYKKNGLLAITVDQAPATGEYADSSSCCGQPTFPNLPVPTGAAKLSAAGGGQVGLLLLSPFVKKGGGLAQETYNHFSLLATIEQLFGLARLGYAGGSEVKPFNASLF